MNFRCVGQYWYDKKKTMWTASEKEYLSILSNYTNNCTSLDDQTILENR